MSGLDRFQYKALYRGQVTRGQGAAVNQLTSIGASQWFPSEKFRPVVPRRELVAAEKRAQPVVR